MNHTWLSATLEYENELRQEKSENRNWLEQVTVLRYGERKLPR